MFQVFHILFTNEIHLFNGKNVLFPKQFKMTHIRAAIVLSSDHDAYRAKSYSA